MKTLYKILTLLFLIGSVYHAEAQKSKGRTGTFALTNATIETVTNGTIESGILVIKDGKISDIGSGISIPQDAESIDCSGLTIYPGMIEGGGRLGLTEVNSDARTRDFNEIGEVIPQMQALTAVNPNSVLIPVTRINGVTTSLAVPTGGLFPGTAALINLHGYTPDQMYAGFKGVVMNFPSTGRSSRWDRRTDEEIKKEAEKKLKKLNEVWGKAIRYHKIDSALSGDKDKIDYYPEMEALLPVIRGESKLLIEVNASKDIQAALDWIEDRNVDVVFTGVSEGWRKAEEIAKAEIPVIVGPVLSIPNRAYDSYDRSYTNPGVLHKAGVKVAIRTADAENVRNLPYNAGFAATYGLDKEEALKAVTINSAEIFGVSDKLGSLEKGKNANLFITDGDPFETKTQVKHVFIDGWKIPLESRHTKLYDEFLDRSPGVEE